MENHNPKPNPRVYFDITIDGERIERMVMELDAQSFPNTAENFRALCTGEKGRGKFTKPLHFKGTRFYQVRPQFFCCSGRERRDRRGVDLRRGLLQRGRRHQVQGPRRPVHVLRRRLALVSVLHHLRQMRVDELSVPYFRAGYGGVGSARQD
ncbi:hypothetical protein Tsubulata_021953 [Turnera subulata]|uniref:PPIase cyclophilin-type domain-containing protein n=1 Tax=Turnera subulata TaxID=218843 RepID=A0A9Q0FDL0_9ROSI|nr:hypothetical protein Tsubulata_021953 [Turnera subulata]